MPSPPPTTQDRSSRRRPRSRSPSSEEHSRRHRHRSRSRDAERSRRHEKSSRRDNHRPSREHEKSSQRRSPSPSSREDRSSHRRRTSRERERKPKRESEENDKGALRKAAGPLPSQEAAFTGGDKALVPGEKPVEKQLPNFQPTGALVAASNSIAQADGSTIVLKYHEPGEARKPPAKDAWKLFVFKGSDIVDTIELASRSCWLVGKERAVVDLLAEHPSISRQHAVIQFRYVEKRNEFGDKLGKVRPYLIDLESGNGTLLNGEKVEAARYLELRDKDMLKFGHSTREYVLMLPPK